MGTKRLLVEDVMTFDPTVIAVDATLEEADLVLRSTLIKGLPVVDGHGALVGVISHADLAAYRFSDREPSVEPDRLDPKPARG